MRNDLGIKLIAVINSLKLVLYEAKGIKITKTLEELPIVLEKHHHHKQERTQSHYYKKSTPESTFEPHSSPKDLEYQEAAKNASEILTKKINSNNNYKELIIVAESKMLGCVRQSINNHLKRIIHREIAKDLVGHDIQSIEQSIFS